MFSSFNTAILTVQALQNKRNDSDFNSFFENVLEKSKAHTFVKTPVLEGKRKPNPRYDHSEAAAEFPATANDKYRRQYYEALDLLISSIKTRFSQPSFQAYQNLEPLLLNGLQNVEVNEHFTCYRIILRVVSIVLSFLLSWLYSGSY